MTDIERISDELEIRALLHTYARAVDTKDWELYRSVFTHDAHIDYSSAGAAVGPRDEMADWLAAGFGAIPWTMHYITNIEIEISAGGQERSDSGNDSGGQERSDSGNDSETATARAMFYNPMQLPGMAEQSCCGGFYHHELVRTSDGWRSTRLREDNVWFVNPPGG